MSPFPAFVVTVGKCVVSSVSMTRLPFQCAVGSCGRAGVDVELVFVLKCLKLVCVPGDEDVDIQLSLEQRQTGHVAPGDHLMAVDETNLKLAHCHHLLLRVVQVLRRDMSSEKSVVFI